MARSRKVEVIERPTALEEARWAAVKARDKAADGRFYFSVATTGVYCRPSCPSRQAKRSNVRFHATCAEAEAAGFRPCKRCTPGAMSLEAVHAAAIAAACRAIESADVAPSLNDLAARAGLSPFHFHRIFKAKTGLTPKAYATANRHKRVRENLTRSGTVTEAIYESGFNSSGRFYANARNVLGMSPKDYKAGGANSDIRFAVGSCSLGSILVAATEKGVAAVLLGDDAESLLHDLQDRFPRANLIGGDRKFEKIAGQVIGAIEQPGRLLDLPLDVQGTAFQHKVWTALKSIPLGATASYSDVARRIGAAKSVRAVARACAANPIAVVIPCHRVIRTDGSISGYRWGLERKRALLQREAEYATPKPSSRRRG